MQAFENLTQVLAWFRIAISPFLIGIVLSVLVYMAYPTSLGAILSFGIVTLSLVLGVLWANKVHSKYGSVEFVSKVIASPDLDKSAE